MSKITVDEVKKLASLSRFKVSDEEAKKYAQQIEAILGYVELLQQVDTEGLEPTSQVTGLENVSRKDEPDDYKVTPESLIERTPETMGRYIKVPKVL